MAREITVHRSGVGMLNEKLRLEAYDDPDPTTKSNYKYQLYIKMGNEWEKLGGVLTFQKGPLVKEPSVSDPNPQPSPPNGFSSEVLLAILIDHLQGFQSGPFSCRENSLAITKCEEALLWLQKRTKSRADAGKEGRQVP